MSANLKQLLYRPIQEIQLSTSLESIYRNVNIIFIIFIFKEFYYLARRNASPLGKLHFKYHNQLARLKKSGLCGKYTRTKKEAITENTLFNLEPQLEDEHHYQALRNDVLSLEELIFHWKGCSSKRLAYIAKNTTKDIFDKWPHYKESTGYKLISIDYFTKYNDNGRMLDEVSTTDFYGKIVVIMKAQIKDPQSNIMLNTLMTDSAVTLNGKYATIFTLLHAILKNNPFKETINEDGRKQKIRCSIKECQNSFIYCCDTAEKLEQHLDKLVNGKQTIQPFIAVVGKSVIYPEHVIVYMDGIKYKVASIVKAIDICFKSFQIYNLKYPSSSHVVWQFIQIYFYNLKVVNDSVHCTARNLKKQLDSI